VRWSAEIKVGLLVVLAGILLTVLLTMASDWVVGTPGEELTIVFDSVSNLKRGAHVLLSGVSIGRVIRFHVDETDRVSVTIRVEPPVKLREGVTAELAMLGFVGEAYVHLTNGPHGNPPLDWSRIVDGQQPMAMMDVIRDVQTGITEAVDAITETRASIEQSSGQVVEIADSVRRLVDSLTAAIDSVSEDVDPLLADASEVVSGVKSRLPELMDNADGLVRQARGDIESFTQSLRSLTDDANEWTVELRESTRRLSADAEASLAEVRKSVASLTDAGMEIKSEISKVAHDANDVLAAEKERVDETLDALDATVASARVLLERLDRLAMRIDSGEGVVGQLMTDDELVPAMRETFGKATDVMARIESLAARVDAFASDSHPTANVGLELTYRGEVRGLQPELGLRLSPSSGRAVYGAVSTRDDQHRYTAVVSQRVGNFWGRIGYIESEAALGVDWEILPQFTLRAEALRVTRPLLDARDDVQWPRFDAEILWRVLPRTRVIIGAEDIGDNAGIVFGMRTGY